jgi:hypothetical protein
MDGWRSSVLVSLAIESKREMGAVEAEAALGNLQDWVCEPLGKWEGQDHSGKCQSRGGQQPHGRPEDHEQQPKGMKKSILRPRPRILQFCQKCSWWT